MSPVAALVAVVAAGCDTPAGPAGAPLPLALRIAAAAPAELRDVLAKVDRLAIHVTRPDGVRRDTVLPLVPDGEGMLARIVLDPREHVPEARIRAELLAGSAVLFGGEAVLAADSAGSARTRIVVRPVPARIANGLPSSLSFDALGQTLSLGGAVVFATGDTLPGEAPTWTSPFPDVISVVGGNAAVVRGNGDGALVARYGELVAVASVQVLQIATSLDVQPASATLRIGESVRFTAIGRDRNGFPVPPGVIGWTSSDARVANVDGTGLVTGVGWGDARVIASSGSTQGLATVTVLLSADIPRGAAVWRVGADLGVGEVRTGAWARLATISGSQLTRAPDGSGIAVMSDDELWVMDAHGQGLGALSTPQLVRGPEYSADGRWIYYSSPRPSVYRIRPDGSELEQVSPDGLDAEHPTTSPDGQHVAYASDGDLVVQAIGGAPRVILADARPLTPTWSPDGAWIAYVRGGRVFIVRPDGSGRTQVGGANLGLSWSPDGQWLLSPGNPAWVLHVPTRTRADLSWGSGSVSWWR